MTFNLNNGVNFNVRSYQKHICMYKHILFTDHFNTENYKTKPVVLSLDNQICKNEINIEDGQINRFSKFKCK